MSGCSSCGSDAEDLRVDGPIPFTRCLAATPNRDGEFSVGGLMVTFEDRTVSLEGASPLRFAAFAGPAPFAVELTDVLSEVRDGEVHFVVVLGGFGDDASALTTTLEALGSLELPVFLVPGGRDDALLLEHAQSDLQDDIAARIIDLSPFDRLIVGPIDLVPIAGAPVGRYGRTAAACGFLAGDLDDRAERIGEANEAPRYLLSWAAPSGGIAVGIAGVDAGDPMLEEFAHRVGAQGGLFAWPGEAAGRVDETDGRRSEVLRRIKGAPSLRGDGARPPTGPSFFTTGTDGISSP